MRFGAMSAIALGWSLGLAGSAVAEEGGIYLGGGVTLTSDYMFRGVSQTLGDPAAHAWLDVELESGVYGYVWAANVDFVPAGEQADGARYEINTAVGFAAEFSEAWSVDTMLVRYLFPGTVESVNYDYNELLITLGYSERVFATVGYSDDVFGADADGWFYALSGHVDLPGELSLSARGGYYDLDAAFEASYAFSDVAVSLPVGDVVLTLAWHDTYGATGELFFPQTVGSRVVLSLDFEFER